MANGMGGDGDPDHRKLLHTYIHDYLVKKKLYDTAKIFRTEANVDDISIYMNSPVGFLNNWWNSYYYDLFGPNKEAIGQGLLRRRLWRTEEQHTHPIAESNRQIISNNGLDKNNNLPESINRIVMSESKKNIIDELLSTPHPFSSPSTAEFDTRNLPSTSTAKFDTRNLPSTSTAEFDTRNLPSTSTVDFADTCNLPSTSYNQYHLINHNHKPDVNEFNDILMLLQNQFQTNVTTPYSLPFLSSSSIPHSGSYLTLPDAMHQGRVFEGNGSSLASIPNNTNPLLGSYDAGTNNQANHINRRTYTEENRFVYENTKSIGSIVLKDLTLKFLYNLPSNESKFLCCHFSSNGMYLAAAGFSTKISIWDVGNVRSLPTSTDHLSIVTDIRFQQNSTIFASSSLDKTLKIWDAATPDAFVSNLLGHSGNVYSLDFQSNNILFSSDNEYEIRQWDVTRSTTINVFKAYASVVRFQPKNGKLLALASGNEISLFNTETRKIQFSWKGHKKQVVSLCWDYSGDQILSVSEDRALLFSVKGGKCISQLDSKGEKYYSCTIHPLYKMWIIGCPKKMEVWNQNLTRTITFEAGIGMVTALAESMETKMVASAGDDKCVKLWNGKILQ